MSSTKREVNLIRCFVICIAMIFSRVWFLRCSSSFYRFNRSIRAEEGMFALRWFSGVVCFSFFLQVGVFVRIILSCKLFCVLSSSSSYESSFFSFIHAVVAAAVVSAPAAAPSALSSPPDASLAAAATAAATSAATSSPPCAAAAAAAVPSPTARYSLWGPPGGFTTSTGQLPAS